MSKPSARNVLKIIVEIARSIKSRGRMLNERYLHHYFSHHLQERYDLLNLGEDRNPIGLHPEWPTHKKQTEIFCGRYKKEQRKYRPTADGTAGFIDFAIGDYKKPYIGIEFSLKYGWAHEEVVYDFLKLLDERNPFNAVFSFNVIFRQKGLTKGGHLINLERRMNDAYKEGSCRLNSNNADDFREVYSHSN